MRYLVMGAGSLGSVFGGLLQERGQEVTFVGTDDHLLAMQEKGLTITGIWGEHRLERVKAYYGTEGLSGTFDVILLSVKSYHTTQVISQALPFMEQGSLVVSLQNGLGNWEAIAAAVGWDRTVGARVIFGAAIEAPGTARVTVYADKVLLGSPSGSVEQERMQPVCDAFNDARIPTLLSENIESSLWGKVLYNCALNPMGAILNVPYGALREVPEVMEVVHRIIDEIFAVAGAKGVRLGYEHPDDYFRTLVDDLLPPTASHRSSMLQDMEKGRRTEIDALNGAIGAYGRQLGIPAPVNDVITAIIKGFERRQS